MGAYQHSVQPRLLARLLDGEDVRAVRRRVCAGLHGEVLEIGYGSGLNQPHLPAAVRRVTAVEPSAVALRLSRGRRAASPVPVRLGAEDAQQLPYADATFDAALSTWTLCGIADPVAALREVRRVLRPGGVLHFVEHGLGPDPAAIRWQRRCSPLNRRLAGCVLDRDVPALLAAAGLPVRTCATYHLGGVPRFASHLYEGRAG